VDCGIAGNLQEILGVASAQVHPETISKVEN
jgi:hypothetical protein